MGPKLLSFTRPPAPEMGPHEDVLEQVRLQLPQIKNIAVLVQYTDNSFHGFQAIAEPIDIWTFVSIVKRHADDAAQHFLTDNDTDNDTDTDTDNDATTIA